MSLIHVIEQLGTNSSLQQLSQSQLMSMFSDTTTDSNQLAALFAGNVEALSELLEVPVYRCVVEHATEEVEEPADQDEDQPADEDDDQSAQQSVQLQ